MYRSGIITLAWLILLPGVAGVAPCSAYAQDQQNVRNTSGKFAGCKQLLESIPREEAAEVAYYGVIASIRHEDAEALSNFMQFIPEKSRNEETVLRLIGRGLNRHLLDAVRSRYIKMYRDEFRRYYAEADASNGEVLDELTPRISCELTTILAAAAIAADEAGHKSNAGKLARRAWECWNSCMPADRGKLSVIDLASACARAEMWPETQALLDAEVDNYPPEFSMVVGAIARQQIRTDRIKDAVATVSSRLSKNDAEFLHVELVDEFIRDGRLERAIEYSRIQGVEGVNATIAEELARSGRIDEASELIGKMTALHRLSWQVMSAGDFLKKGMTTDASLILADVLGVLDAIHPPIREGDATQISQIYLLALPHALELDDTETTHRILAALSEYLALENIDSLPISAGISFPSTTYAQAAVVLAEYGRVVGADLFFRKAWQQEKNSYFCHQLLIVTMATVGRFSVCHDLANETGDHNLSLLAAYCEGYWKRRAFQNPAPADSTVSEPRHSDVALELCQKFGSISGEKDGTFEFPGFIRRADSWFVDDSHDR